MGDSRTQSQHLSGYKLQLSTCAAPSLPVAVLLSCETLLWQVWEPCVSVEVELRTAATCALAGASWVLSGVSGFRATQRYRFQTETPFRRCAELDFGFLPVATPAGMHTCYPELQLSTHAAGLIAYHLSCETLPELLQKPRVSAETQLRTSAARTLPRAALILSGVSSQTGASLKCRWFFGRVFSFPLVEESV